MRAWMFAGVVLALAGCMPGTSSIRWVGDSRNGIHNDFGYPVSPEEALKLAQPYLAKSYQLRCKDRPENMNSGKETTDYVTVQGEWYCIVRDSYTDIYPDYYSLFAVKVHTKTGLVEPPKPDDRPVLKVRPFGEK